MKGGQIVTKHNITFCTVCFSREAVPGPGMAYRLGNASSMGKCEMMHQAELPACWFGGLSLHGLCDQLDVLGGVQLTSMSDAVWRMAFYHSSFLLASRAWL
jgi:hypothetical protein